MILQKFQCCNHGLPQHKQCFFRPGLPGDKAVHRIMCISINQRWGNVPLAEMVPDHMQPLFIRFKLLRQGFGLLVKT